MRPRPAKILPGLLHSCSRAQLSTKANPVPVSAATGKSVDNESRRVDKTETLSHAGNLEAMVFFSRVCSFVFGRTSRCDLSGHCKPQETANSWPYGPRIRCDLVGDLGASSCSAFWRPSSLGTTRGCGCASRCSHCRLVAQTLSPASPFRRHDSQFLTLGRIFLHVAVRYDWRRHVFEKVSDFPVHDERALHENVGGLCTPLLARQRVGFLPVHAFSSAAQLAQGAMAAHASQARRTQSPSKTRSSRARLRARHPRLCERRARRMVPIRSARGASAH